MEIKRAGYIPARLLLQNVAGSLTGMTRFFIEQDSTTARQIAQCLTTEHFVSGVSIAAQLKLSRAAVSEHIQKMRQAGLPVAVVKGRGYRLMAKFETMDAASLNRALSDLHPHCLQSGQLLWSVDSTNRYLARGHPPDLNRLRFCLSELQTAGRGRRGRSWVSPLGSSLYLSLIWQTDMEPQALQGLSLSVGIAAARVLMALGVRDIGLKWPNDLIVCDRKLGGILMELNGRAGGPAAVVVGLGLNIGMNADQATGIDQPWTDLESWLPGSILRRSEIAALFIRELALIIQGFDVNAGANLPNDWHSFDRLRGREVTAFAAGQPIEGFAEGIDETGAFLLRTENGLRRFLSGEVSIRKAGQMPPDQGQ